MRPEPNVIGKLSLGVAGYKRDGKLIDTWCFASPHEEMAKQEIEVYMVKGGGGTTAPSIRFVARSVLLPGGKLEHSDISVLREQVAAICTEHFTALSGVVWEDWLEVRVAGGDNPFGGLGNTGADLRIAYSALKRGRHPTDPARDYTLSDYGHAVPFPAPKLAGEDEDAKLNGGKDFSRNLNGWRLPRDTAMGYSYIPDTPGNRAALDHMIDALVRLRTRLADFLGQNHIEHAVAALHQQLVALPATVTADSVTDAARSMAQNG